VGNSQDESMQVGKMKIMLDMDAIERQLERMRQVYKKL
jgi:hypothetical protein